MNIQEIWHQYYDGAITMEEFVMKLCELTLINRGGSCTQEQFDRVMAIYSAAKYSLEALSIPEWAKDLPPLK